MAISMFWTHLASSWSRFATPLFLLSLSFTWFQSYTAGIQSFPALPHKQKESQQFNQLPFQQARLDTCAFPFPLWPFQPPTQQIPCRKSEKDFFFLFHGKLGSPKIPVQLVGHLHFQEYLFIKITRCLKRKWNFLNFR